MKNTRRSSSGFGLIVVAILLCATTAYDQVPQGQILGSITDPSGSAVLGATIVLENEATRLKRTTTTTNTGDYVFPALDSGTYRVTVQMAGFDTVVSPGITVQILEKRRADFQLRVGKTQTQIEVVGTTAKLDTDSATVGTTVSSREVTQMPLNGREFSQLAVLMPGVVATGTWGAGGYFISGGFSTQIRVGGTPAAKSTFNYDGTDNGLARVNGPAISPSIDSIQEFHIERSQFQAEYGRGGAGIDLVTKGGSNAFHGTAWDYVRNNALNAGNYITHKQDTLKRNQFGANIGGPIRKDKAFFFFNWESQRRHSSTQQLGSVFTAKMHSGDLSEFTKPIKDPKTGLPFPGNIIPQNRLNSLSVGFMDAYLPLPNLGSGIVNNFIRSSVSSDNWDQYVTRVDYNLSEKDRLFARFSSQTRTENVLPLTVTSTASTSSFRFYNANVGWTRNWTPSTLSEVRFGWHEEPLFQKSLPLQKYASQNILGIGENVPRSTRVPIAIIDPFYNFAEWGFPVNIHNHSYELISSVSTIKGKHTIKAGYVGQWLTSSHPLDGLSPMILVFNGVYSSNGVADFLLGSPFVAQDKLPWVPKTMKTGDHSPFIQDDWKVTQSLTFNLGLRYELHVLPTEKHDLWSSFEPDLGLMVVAGNKGIQTQFTQPVTLASWSSILTTADKTNLPRRTLTFGDYNNFAPRLGFAWRPFKNNKTVVRGGYGIFYLVEDPFFTGGLSDFAAPYGALVRLVDAGGIPGFNLATPWNIPGIAVPPPNSQYRDPHSRDAYMQDTTLGMQRELPWGMVGEINFQDQNSKKLETMGLVNMNQPRAGGSGPIGPRRPFPNLGALLPALLHDGKTRYDALELILRKRSTHYTFQWSDVWAKNIGRTIILDNFNKDMWYGPGNYVAHQDKLNFLIDVPVGKGRRFLNQGGVVDAVVGGWTISSIAILHQSGNPFTIAYSGDPSNTGAGEGRADRVCDGRVSNPTQQQWFNTSCFVAPQPGTFGNAGTGILVGPPRFFADFSLLKNFTLHENVKLQFRSEMFNVFNHPNLAAPQATQNFSTFGKILTKDLSPRVIQLALRLEF